jgi:hypothetical protein
VGNVTEGTVKRPEVLPQGGMRIEVERSSHLLRNFRNGNPFAMEFATLVRKVMHAKMNLSLEIS